MGLSMPHGGGVQLIVKLAIDLVGLGINFQERLEVFWFRGTGQSTKARSQGIQIQR